MQDTRVLMGGKGNFYHLSKLLPTNPTWMALSWVLPYSFSSSSQVEVAKKHIAYHMEKFGYQKPNVEFLQGYVENLGDVGLADESYDIVM